MLTLVLVQKVVLVWIRFTLVIIVVAVRVCRISVVLELRSFLALIELPILKLLLLIGKVLVWIIFRHGVRREHIQPIWLTSSENKISHVTVVFINNLIRSAFIRLFLVAVIAWTWAGALVKVWTERICNLLFCLLRIHLRVKKVFLRYRV